MCIAFEQRGWAVQASHASEPLDIPARRMKATLQEQCSSNTSCIFGYSGKSNRKWFCIRHGFLERSAYNFSHSWVSVNSTEKTISCGQDSLFRKGICALDVTHFVPLPILCCVLWLTVWRRPSLYFPFVPSSLGLSRRFLGHVSLSLLYICVDAQDWHVSRHFTGCPESHFTVDWE
jgi:hypothetical protein